MSWVIDRPSPVPSPAGLVVKNGLNIFSFTSGGNARAVVADADFDGVAEILRGGEQRRLEARFAIFGLALGRGIEAVRDQIEQRAGDLLRKQFG